MSEAARNLERPPSSSPEKNLITATPALIPSRLPLRYLHASLHGARFLAAAVSVPFAPRLSSFACSS
jgi:hypothetical protein